MAIHTQSGSIVYPACPVCGSRMRAPLQVSGAPYTVTTRHSATPRAPNSHRIAITVQPDGTYDVNDVPDDVSFEDVLMGQSTVLNGLPPR